MKTSYEADYCDEQALKWALTGHYRNVAWLHALGAMYRGIEAGDSLLAESHESAKGCWREPEIMRWLAATTEVHEGLLTANFIGVVRACVFTDGTWQPEPVPDGVKAGVAAITIPVFGGRYGQAARQRASILWRSIRLIRPGGAGERRSLPCWRPMLKSLSCAAGLRVAALRLYRSPLGWLKGGFAPFGYCVLDWESPEARDLLFLIDRGAVIVVFDDDAHATEIRDRARPKRRPSIRAEVAA